MTIPCELVVFDGDNTLWNVEQLYDSAREKFCAIAPHHGFTSEEFEAHQRALDAQLYKAYGYSRLRFAQSFKETLAHFVSSPSAEALEAVGRIAERVFETAAPVHPGVDEVLQALLAKGKRLALVTAGDTDVQRLRLEHFRREHLFQLIRIVPTKTAEALAALLKDLETKPQDACMVGDSLRSDILPAVSLGMSAVHLRSQNWELVEIADFAVPPEVPSITSLHQLLQLL